MSVRDQLQNLGKGEEAPPTATQTKAEAKKAKIKAAKEAKAAKAA